MNLAAPAFSETDTLDTVIVGTESLSVKVTVIGSGEILSPESGEEMVNLKSTSP